MTQSPKERFQSNVNFMALYTSAMNNMAVQEGIQAALLQMIRETPFTSDPEVSSANNHRIEGARALIVKMSEMSVKPVPTAKQPVGNLDHKA